MYHLTYEFEDIQLTQPDIEIVEELIANSNLEFSLPIEDRAHGLILARLDERGGNPLIVDGKFISWGYPPDATTITRYKNYLECRERVFKQMENFAILRLRSPTIHQYYAYMVVKKWEGKFYPLITIDPVKYKDGLYTMEFDHSIHDNTHYNTRELFNIFFGFIRTKLNQPQ